MKGKVAPPKSTTKAYVSFCFSLSAAVSPALYLFFLSTVKQTKLLHSISEMFFTFLARKTLSKTFLVECVRSGAASCNKRWEFWRETHTPLWLLIGRIIFLTHEKTSLAILIGRIIFFTCENYRSLF